MKHISIIVAIAENFAIGSGNQLLCHLPDDLKKFKKITSGHRVIMGKNTFLSLPNGALPNRTNIVISDDKNDHFEGCTTVFSIDEALGHCDDNESFIIGGGMIYRQFLPFADKLYLTLIDSGFEGDTFFPEIDYSQWTEVSKEYHSADEKHPFGFIWLELIR